MTGPNGQGMDVTEIHGDEARDALDKVAGDASVVDLGRELGVDPNEVLRSAKVERLPETIENFEEAAGKLYVSVTWVDNSERTVRTSHFVPSDDGSIDSNVARVPKTSAEPASFGKLGGPMTTVTESEVQRAEQSVSASSDFIDCLADCLGISAGFVTAVLAGCGLVCAITLGTGCIVCAAAAFGFSVGTVGGCFGGCAA